jgi:glycosyltransferase A (GT-A) superfamily protein (DUF2064 family)
VGPETFGSGNKFLHNVIKTRLKATAVLARRTVVAIHSGRHLCVQTGCACPSVVEANLRAAITDVLKRHDGVRALFDGGCNLFALDEDGQMAWRYNGNLKWSAMADVSAFLEIMVSNPSQYSSTVKTTFELLCVL